MRTGRTASTTAKLALACALLAGSLLLAEAALRVADWPPADPVWKAHPPTAFKFAEHLRYRHMQPEYDVLFETNSLGLRDDEVGPEVGLKVGPRVLLLGDSFACGYGVQRRETFADLLDDALAADVINAGVGGYEIVHQLRYFQTAGKELRPDLAIFALYLGNDITNNRHWRINCGDLVRVDGTPALTPPAGPRLLALVKRNAALRRLVHDWRDDAKTAEPWRPGKSLRALCERELSPQAEEQYATAVELVKQLQTEVQSAGSEFMVVLIPFRQAVEEEPAFSSTPPEHDRRRPGDEMTRRLASAGVETIDLTSELREAHRTIGQPLYYPVDGHFNARGHAHVAEALTPILEERGFGRSRAVTSSTSSPQVASTPVASGL